MYPTDCSGIEQIILLFGWIFLIELKLGPERLKYEPEGCFHIVCVERAGCLGCEAGEGDFEQPCCL